MRLCPHLQTNIPLPKRHQGSGSSLCSAASTCKSFQRHILQQRYGMDMGLLVVICPKLANAQGDRAGLANYALVNLRYQPGIGIHWVCAPRHLQVVHGIRPGRSGRLLQIHDFAVAAGYAPA